jgi:hypothetical protein
LTGESNIQPWRSRNLVASEHGGTEAALEASQACVGPEVRKANR